MQQKSKEKIRRTSAIIENLKDIIEEEANRAMEAEGVKIPYRNPFTGEVIEGVYDDAQWFHISVEWYCFESPFGYCMYHKIRDPNHDGCVFCGQPSERK